MKTRLTLLSLIFACLNATWAQPYQADWDSLSRHEDAPEWFKDAKLGIYFHWGVYAVPAFGSEWYPRNMFLKGNGVNKHHLETYGDPAEYGYDRFVAQWKTPNFDAGQWARLFRRAGARFAGPVAEHHDGFSLWDSDVTPWNAKDKGPKRDLVGELAKGIRGEGMKVITTFHHARNHYGHFDWMTVNGEAIYATRPWETFGEGPTVEPEGGFSERGKFLKLEYSDKDIRYTQSKDGRTVYAVTCGWPGKEAVLSAVKVVSTGSTAKVALLGRSGQLKYHVNEKGRLVIHLPDLSESLRPGKHAFSFKLQGFELSAATPIQYGGPEPIILSAEKALLDGSKLGLETKTSKSNIGFWDNPKEKIHWLVKIPAAGTYGVQGEFAAMSGQSSLKVEVAGKTLSLAVANTGRWDKPKTVKAGTIMFDKPGVYHLALSAQSENWRAVNVWNV